MLTAWEMNVWYIEMMRNENIEWWEGDKWNGMDLSICLGLRLRPHPNCFIDKITWDYTANLARDETMDRADLLQGDGRV